MTSYAYVKSIDEYLGLTSKRQMWMEDNRFMYNQHKFMNNQHKDVN